MIVIVTIIVFVAVQGIQLNDLRSIWLIKTIDRITIERICQDTPFADLLF